MSYFQQCHSQAKPTSSINLSINTKMRDPFFHPPSVLLRATQPIASFLSLRTLPFHTHEIIPAFSFYHFLNIFLAPRISARLFPRIYRDLPERTKVNWNSHVVSLVQSCFINTLALWVIFMDRERRAMGPRERVWGYTGATGMVQGFSAGYFLWDLMMGLLDVDVHGWGAVAHAISALAVSCLGFVGLPCLFKMGLGVMMS